MLQPEDDEMNEHKKIQVGGLAASAGSRGKTGAAN